VSLNEHIWLVWNFCVIIGYIINCYFYFYYYGVDQVSNKREKLRNQLKSNMYYIFWGAATLSVLAGQVLVGTGYRRMSDSMDAISADINLLVEVLTVPVPQKSRGYYSVPNPEDYGMTIIE